MYGELHVGRTLLQARILQNVLNFRAIIVNANDKQFSKTLYHVMYNMYKLNKTRLINSDWILHVKINCLDNCNLYNHRITQGVPNINQSKNNVKECT